MAVFLPLVVTMDISLAVTLSDWDVHWLRLNGATEAIFAACVYDGLMWLSSAFQEHKW